MRVPSELRKCVCFLQYRTERGERLAGTAFWIMKPFDTSYQNFHGYLVTAKHIIENIYEITGSKEFYIRVNKPDGTKNLIPTDITRWTFSESDDLIDIAVLYMELPLDNVDYKAIPEYLCANDAVIRRQRIGLGDEILVTGLFVHHAGTEYNEPIIRTGNIAAMPREPVKTRSGNIEAYIVEARSIGGLSGSPVFVHIAPTRFYRPGVLVQAGSCFYLLGLVHGHWDAPADQMDAVEDMSAQHEKINTGVAIVTPIKKLLNLLAEETAVRQRQKIERH